jgi:hypothetical protein
MLSQYKSLAELLTRHLAEDGTVLMFTECWGLKQTADYMEMGGLLPYKVYFKWKKTNPGNRDRLSKCPLNTQETILYMRKKTDKTGRQAAVNFTNSWDLIPMEDWRFQDTHMMPACSDAEKIKMGVSEGGVMKHIVVRYEQKPIRYLIPLILMFTEPGDLVIDPFCGVGSTAVACMMTGRRFWGCDMATEAVVYAKARIKCLSSNLRSGASTLKPAYNWSMYRENYYGKSPKTIETEDVGMVEKLDVVYAGSAPTLLESPIGTPLTKEEEESLVRRIKAQARGRARASAGASSSSSSAAPSSVAAPSAAAPSAAAPSSSGVDIVVSFCERAA